jgi:DNA topoisomerase-3
MESYRDIAKTRYVNDKQITDHYAIIPTGQGFSALRSLNPLAMKVYEVISRRFLSIFYPAAVYQKYALELIVGQEHFFANFKVLAEPGYLKVADISGKKKIQAKMDVSAAGQNPDAKEDDSEMNQKDMENPAFIAMLASLKKGMELPLIALNIKEGETSPPKRYSSGSMILAMENAGQLIEDEELRAQIKGSGIGTSATRAEILKKLVTIKYLALNGKTQIITPTLLGELVYEVVFASMKQMLNPELTASWEKGLTYVAEGSITSEEYMQKLEQFVSRRTYSVLNLNNQFQLREYFDRANRYYQKK